jgi:TonB family protein
MKICSTCNRQYEDETISFCLDDGTRLVHQFDPTTPRSADATLHLPSSPAQPPPTVRMTEPGAAARPTMISPETPPPPAMSGTTYGVERRKGGALLWVLGALIIGVAAVAVAFIVTRNRGGDANSANQLATASPAPAASEAAPAGPTSNAETGTATPPQSQSRSATPTPVSKPAAEPEVLAKERETRGAANNAANQEPAPAEKAAPRAPISGGVLNGKAVNLVTPAYPAAARAVHASGSVTVQVLIDENGNVASAHAVSGHPLLQSAAVNAARASKFKPTTLSGQAVKVNGTIVYNFVAQ